MKPLKLVAVPVLCSCLATFAQECEDDIVVKRLGIEHRIPKQKLGSGMTPLIVGDLFFSGTLHSHTFRFYFDEKDYYEEEVDYQKFLELIWKDDIIFVEALPRTSPEW